MAKKTMTLNLSEAEMSSLDKLSTELGRTKTDIVRGAIRMRVSFEDHIKQGFGFQWIKPGEARSLGCGWEGMD